MLHLYLTSLQQIPWNQHPPLVRRDQITGSYAVLLSCCLAVLLFCCPPDLLSSCPSVHLSCCHAVMLSCCHAVKLTSCPAVLLSYCPAVLVAATAATSQAASLAMTIDLCINLRQTHGMSTGNPVLGVLVYLTRKRPCCCPGHKLIKKGNSQWALWQGDDVPLRQQGLVADEPDLLHDGSSARTHHFYADVLIRRSAAGQASTNLRKFVQRAQIGSRCKSSWPKKLPEGWFYSSSTSVFGRWGGSQYPTNAFAATGRRSYGWAGWDKQKDCATTHGIHIWCHQHSCTR